MRRRTTTRWDDRREYATTRCDATRRNVRGHNNQQDAGRLDKATRQQNDSGWLEEGMTRRKRDEDRNGYADVFYVRLMGDEDVIDYDDYNEDDDDDDQDNNDNATITVGNN